MKNVILHLRRADGILTLHIGGIRLAHRRCAADGTGIADDVRHGARGAFLEDDRLHARDDLAGFIDEDRVADAHIQPRDIVLIVQGRTLHARAAELHGVEYRRRRDAPRTTDGELDLPEHRLFFLGRILIGDCPARRLCRRPQLRALRKIVDLDHRAVDVIGQTAAARPDLLDRRPHFVRRAANAISRDDLYPLRAHKVICRRMRRKRPPLRALQVKDEHREPALARYARIELTQCSRRTVARIRKRLQPQQLLPLVDCRKRRALHIDLAAHFKIHGRVAKLLPHICNHARVLRHVLALHDAVAARDGTREHAVFVTQRERQPVDLLLDDKLRRRKMRAYARNKLPNLRLAEHVL